MRTVKQTSHVCLVGGITRDEDEGRVGRRWGGEGVVVVVVVVEEVAGQWVYHAREQ